MSVSRLTSSSWRVPSGDAAAERGAEHRERDLARVPADEHRHRVADPRPHRPALGDRVDQPGQVGVGEHEVGRAARGGRLGAARAADAHADVGEPDRRGVVHAVAGHRQRRAGPAQRGDQRHLLLRRQPREHRRLPHHRDPLGVRRPQELRAGHDPVGVRDAGLGGDRRRGLGMVAGGDEHPHARRPQLRDRDGRRLPHAVGERDEPAQGEAAARPRRGRPGTAVDRPVRDGDHPQALVGQALHPLAGRPRRPCTGPSTTSGAPLTTSRPSRTPAENPRPAANGRQDSGVGARPRARFADGRGDAPGRSRATCASAGSPADRGQARAGRPRRCPSAERHEPDHPQPVLGQRAGLVEADGVDPAQRLQHPRAAHDRAAAGQPAGGGLLGDGRDQRQPLGHGGDRDRHARPRRPPAAGGPTAATARRRPRRRRA